MIVHIDDVRQHRVGGVSHKLSHEYAVPRQGRGVRDIFCITPPTIRFCADIDVNAWIDDRERVQMHSHVVMPTAST